MRKVLRTVGAILIFIPVSQGSIALAGEQPMAEKPSVILIMGDGLGINLQFALRAIDGPLAIDTMQMTLVKTGAANDIVTDSAASASAMSTGFKTKNKQLGMSPKGERLPNLGEAVLKSGMQLGLVTTSYLFDASPMAFAVHEFDRKQTDSITKQVLALRPTVLMGGGEGDLLPAEKMGNYGPGKRKDGMDLLANFRKAGYSIAKEPQFKTAPQLSLLATKEMFSTEHAPIVPLSPVTLPTMLQAALSSLDAKKGFLLVAEEERTDEAGHANDVTGALEGARHWNQAVAVALAYREAHPNTVVLVASDHETGGFQIVRESECKTRSPGAVRMKSSFGLSMCLRFTTDQHTAAPVGLYAAGIELPERPVENTEIHAMVRRALGLK